MTSHEGVGEILKRKASPDVSSVIVPRPKAVPLPAPFYQPDKPPNPRKGKFLPRLLLAGTLILGGIGIGIAKVIESNSQKTEISTSFDPSKNEGTMGPSNTIFVSREELKNYPKWTEKGDPIIVISVPKNQETRYKTMSVAPLAQEKGVNNILYQYRIPAGQIIFAPLDGYLVFETPGPKNPLLRGFEMEFTRLDGKRGTFGVGGANESKPFDPVFEALVPAPIVYSTGGDRNKMLVVERGDPILKTTKEVDLAYQIGYAVTSDNFIAQSLNPLTSSNSTTEQKLVSVASQS